LRAHHDDFSDSLKKRAEGKFEDSLRAHHDGFSSSLKKRPYGENPLVKRLM